MRDRPSDADPTPPSVIEPVRTFMSDDPTPLPKHQIDKTRLKLCHAVLFDLDGTIADTAPDLGAAVNKMRHDRGLEMRPLETLRPLASAGARGFVAAACRNEPGHSDYGPNREAGTRDHV